jgi:hypothetical protein
MPEYKGSSDYENLGFLGKGAQGTVFKVKRKTDGEVSDSTTRDDRMTTDFRTSPSRSSSP